MFSGEFDMDFAEHDCENKDDPICPYCKLPHELDWDSEESKLCDGEEWERKCDFCGKDYPVVTNVKYVFTTVKYDEEEEV